MSKSIEFVFDFGSPNAYLSYFTVKAVAARTGAELKITPCLLGEFLNRPITSRL